MMCVSLRQARPGRAQTRTCGPAIRPSTCSDAGRLGEAGGVRALTDGKKTFSSVVDVNTLLRIRTTKITWRGFG